MFPINMENLKKLKYHIFKKNILSLSIVCRKCGHEYEKKRLKKKNQLQHKKFLV